MKRQWIALLFLILSLVGLYLFFQKLPVKTDSKSVLAVDMDRERTRGRGDAPNEEVSSESQRAGRSEPSIGTRLAEPVGFLEASEDCFQTSFPSKISFQELLKSVGVLHETNPVLRENRIFMKDGKEVRLSLGKASQGETWEATIFDVDGDGLPVFRKKETGDSLVSVEDSVFKAFIGMIPTQKEEFLAVNAMDRDLGLQSTGTLWLVNGVPVEMALQIVDGEGRRRSLDCGENRCGCFRR